MEIFKIGREEMIGIELFPSDFLKQKKLFQVALYTNNNKELIPNFIRMLHQV